MVKAKISKNSVKKRPAKIASRPKLSKINLLVFALVFGAVGAFVLHSSFAAIPDVNYFVDCTNGTDTATGISQQAAWKSISRANKASLNPGDHLLLKRGCIWNNQRLEARWNGSVDERILVTAYGEGELPTIHNGDTNDVKVTGSYISMEYLKLTYSTPATTVLYDNNCIQPIGNIYILAFTSGHNNVLRYSDVSGGMTGVHFGADSSYNKIRANKIHDNRIMQNAKGDLGAWGILINGDDNEITGNEIYDNVSKCAIPNNPGRYGSNSAEIYRGKRNAIHHNYVHGDRVFSELGSRTDDIATGNIFAYNLFVSDLKSSRFINTRGNGLSFGPVNDTTVVHNTVYLTGEDSQGIICSGCTIDLLKLKANIIWADTKVIYVTGKVTDENNIFYSSDGMPILQGLTAKSGSVNNPKFINAKAGDFKLQIDSPAINKGGVDLLYNYDKGGVHIPLQGSTDSGAFEYVP